MRAVSFYNEKGGVGKTSLAIMFASWLAYHEGENVVMIDFDNPSYRLKKIRDDELMLTGSLENTELASRYFESRRKVYPVLTFSNMSEACTQSEIMQVKSSVRTLKSREGGYIVCDFPGAFNRGGLTHSVITSGLLDLVVYMVDSDAQSVDSALMVNRSIRENCRKPGGQSVVALWNRETQAERNDKKWKGVDRYRNFDGLLKSAGIPVVRERMHDTPIMRRNETSPRFVRSTICWPEQNIIAAFGGTRQERPYIYDIFNEIRERLDSAPMFNGF